jgi:hypothetical protein
MRHASQVGGAGRVVCGLGGWGRGERVGRRGRAGRDGGPGAGLGSMVRARHPRPQTLDAPPPPRPQIFSAATRLTGRAGRAGRGAGAGGASLVALLSELTGVYAISSLLLIRRNVPLAHRAAIDGAMGGGLEFQFFHRSGGKGEGVVGGGGDCAPSFGAESARHSLPATPHPTPPHPTPPHPPPQKVVQRAVHCLRPRDRGAVLDKAPHGRRRRPRRAGAAGVRQGRVRAAVAARAAPRRVRPAQPPSELGAPPRVPQPPLPLPCASGCAPRPPAQPGPPLPRPPCKRAARPRRCCGARGERPGRRATGAAACTGVWVRRGTAARGSGAASGRGSGGARPLVPPRRPAAPTTPALPHARNARRSAAARSPTPAPRPGRPRARPDPGAGAPWARIAARRKQAARPGADAGGRAAAGWPAIWQGAGPPAAACPPAAAAAAAAASCGEACPARRPCASARAAAAGTGADRPRRICRRCCSTSASCTWACR